MYNYFPSTITVYTEPEERPSFVLKPDGEPYTLTKKVKVGFDLTPKGKQDA